MKATTNSSEDDPFPDRCPPRVCKQTPGGETETSPSENLFKFASSVGWNDWRWQMRSRIRSAEQLKRAIPAIEISDGLNEAMSRFPLAITPYYASLIQGNDPRDPIYQMVVPQAAELVNPSFLKDDPLAEDDDMPIEGLIHRYSDRALLVATTTCSNYCRHCTRKRSAGMQEGRINLHRLRRIKNYLTAHPEVRDVIISGGDPFTLSTEMLEKIVAMIREVPSVDIIRIGTRAPVVMPMRITDRLVQMLRKYHPIWVNTHFNHPNELTPEAAEACARIVDAGIPMGNQSVLLRGVNDSPQVIEQLCRGLIRMRVKPYYLFQCDLINGTAHFCTPLSRGIEIMEYLRGRLSGLAIPTFVVDAPGGGGKIPLLPNYIVSTSPTHTVLRNFEGMMVSYPEPVHESESLCAPREDPASANGVWALASGVKAKIEPADSDRCKRRRMVSASRAKRAGFHRGGPPKDDQAPFG